jgi:hypothetical protein
MPQTTIYLRNCGVFMKLHSRSLVVLAFIAAFTSMSFAKNNGDRTQFNHDIRLQSGESVGELTCINCSIYVSGQVAGDVTTIHGNVMIEEGGSVGGDVTTVMGDIRVEPAGAIGGDATSVGGTLRRQQGASVGGDVTAIESRLAVLLILASPLFVLGMVIALVVWLIQRSRQRTAVPVH